MEWVFLILASALFISLKHIITKKILYKYDTVVVLTGLSFGIMIFTLVGYNFNIQFTIPLKILLMVIFKSIIIACSWYGLTYSIKKLGISIADPLTNLSPVFLVILGYFILGERITLLNLLGVIVIIIGGYILELNSLKDLFLPFRQMKDNAHILVAIGLFGISMSAIIDKVVLQFISKQTLMFYFYATLFITYYLISYLHKNLHQLKELIMEKTVMLSFAAILGLLADAAYFVVVKMPTTYITLIIPLRRLSTFVSVLLGGRIYHEKHLIHRAIVSLFLIAGVFLITL